MLSENSSEAVEIKKLEDLLTRDPNSFCFAPLAELYRRAGRTEQAIQVAKKGCALHPDYVGGLMALGRAYYEQGMNKESTAVLERVVTINPDNLLASKLLDQLYSEAGKPLPERSISNITTNIMGTTPTMAEGSAMELTDDFFSPPNEAFSSTGESDIDVFAIDDEEILEDLEIFEELTEEIVEEEEFVAPEAISASEDLSIIDINVNHSAPPVESPVRDPLMTATLAELYITQGFLSKALDVYNKLMVAEPQNKAYSQRYFEIEKLMETDTGSLASIDLTKVAFGSEADLSSQSLDSGAISQFNDDNSVVAELETWLNNIKRRRDVI
jgi:predicted Zn-dependent protease